MNSTQFIVISLFAFGCNGSSGFPEGPMTDFKLVDTNPSSSTFEMEVSPRDYIGAISGWYFGHGT
jgi:hypothetical protein